MARPLTPFPGGRSARRQRGAILPLTALALVALTGLAGLALDLGHAYLDRTRLQNAVDAAALSGAKSLDQTGSTALASADARAAFDRVAAGAGNGELAGHAPVLGFSATLQPFAPGSGPPRFVRAAVEGFRVGTWLLPLLGWNSLPVGASAVAGPSPGLGRVCDIAPVALCAGQGGDFFGYRFGQTLTLKASTWTAGGIGTGNFQNINLPDCARGANCIREEWAGKYSSCVNSDGSSTVTTDPGQNNGPNFQGLNTRFDCPSPGCGGVDTRLYPPDRVIDAGGSGYPDTHAAYQQDYANGSLDLPLTGQADRRIVKVPVTQCRADQNQGLTSLPVLGVACIFLTQPASQQKKEIYGELLPGGCLGTGQNAGNPQPVLGNGPHAIILYQDFSPGSIQ
jgi:hypothetical protein